MVFCKAVLKCSNGRWADTAAIGNRNLRRKTKQNITTERTPHSVPIVEIICYLIPQGYLIQNVSIFWDFYHGHLHLPKLQLSLPQSSPSPPPNQPPEQRLHGIRPSGYAAAANTGWCICMTIFYIYFGFI